LPNGAAALRCQSSLAECLAHADALCKGDSYEVLYGKDERQLFGTDQSQVEGRQSVAEVHCLGRHAKPTQAVTAPAAPASTSASAAGAPLPAIPPSTPTAPPRACVPGATQSCVGPGACAGGQACLPDGSGFAACDCGKS
jgi:hypothetical protein